MATTVTRLYNNQVNHIVGKRKVGYARLTFGVSDTYATGGIDLSGQIFKDALDIHSPGVIFQLAVQSGGEASLGNGPISAEWVPSTQKLVLNQSFHGASNPAEMANGLAIDDFVIDLEVQSQER